MLLAGILQLLNSLCMVCLTFCDRELYLVLIICSPLVIPNITFLLDSNFTYTVNETDPVVFMCSATGIPPPEITWMRNGVLLDENVDPRISLSNPSDAEVFLTTGGNIYFVSRNLIISNTRDSDSSTYTCVASNGNAVTPNVTQDFELFVNGKLDLYNKNDAIRHW